MTLISGGAGFIGSRLALRIAGAGRRVRVLDSLSPQVHGARPSLTPLRRAGIEVVKGDVTSRRDWIRCLAGVDTVVHLAAETGTAQSMYEIARYFQVNVQGTAVMLDVLHDARASSRLRTLIVASSRAVYGEGRYLCGRHGPVFPGARSSEDMAAGDFSIRCPICRRAATHAETDEGAPFRPMSIYGLTKQVQEQAVLLYAENRGINGFALRYQNVYGPGQSLKNPYTGILAVFSNLARQGRPIDVFEDGEESRDFVYVDDVLDATVRAADFSGKRFVGALNVGSGSSVSVLQVARQINRYFGGRSEIRITRAFRKGDIRHNIASTSEARRVLGFRPKVRFPDGLARFLAWAGSQPVESASAYQRSMTELRRHGYLGKAS